MTTDLFPSDLRKVVYAICDTLDSPMSKRVAKCVADNDWLAISSMKVDPKTYKTPLAYFSDAAACDLLRKCQGLATGIDLEAAAKRSFDDGEKQCFLTNYRFRSVLDGFTSTIDDRVLEHIAQVQKNVSSILGRAPSQVRGGFGPGTVYELKGLQSTVPDKIDSAPHLYHHSWPWLFPWAGTAWATATVDNDFDRKPVFIRGNRFATANKDATTHRTIAIEASVNGFYQKGVGRAIRQRLGKVAIDLNHGESLHKDIAKWASISGRRSTIDIRNASNTVALEAVRVALLKRQDWRDLLESLRAPCTLIDGKWRKLEMFSSMGNGYTFELETLLFYAVCTAACGLNPLTAALERKVLVYGDDIIVPTEHAQTVTAALKFWGFETNVRKTFVDGPFRESCGGDYFLGQAVRPHFIKEFPNAAEQWIGLANGITRLAVQYGQLGLDPSRFMRPWLYALDALPNHVRRCRGPAALGDIVVNDFDETRWQTRWRNGIRYVRCYRPVQRYAVGWKYFTPGAQLASALLGAGDGERGVTPRDSVTGYKLGWVPFS